MENFLGCILFLGVCSLLLYFAVKSDRKRQNEYFKQLNDCLYDSLKRAFKDSND